MTCHSGGAEGSDYFWGEASKLIQAGVRHYYHDKRTPYGNVKISQEDYLEGVEMVHRANKSLHRRPENYMSLLARNWAQVKYSDAIFAIGKLAGKDKVDGGTGWAIQMAIDEEKPVFVFDQDKNKWFLFSYITRNFEECDIPSLTNNFAGIGTRQIMSIGQIAIRDVILKHLCDNQFDGKI